MLYFRVDVNSEIATGHMMRCLSIASAARQKGIDCEFIVADEGAQSFAEEKGFEAYCLNSDWNYKEDELSALCNYLKEKDAKVLIVDSYQATDAYIMKLREFVKVVFIDDIDILRTPVDCLINYNNYGSKEEYRNRYREHLGEQTKFLLGCDYVPLREEFARVEPKFSEEVKGIFISTGGADKYHIALQITEELLRRNLTTDIHVIAGSFHADKRQLKELEKQYTNCVIHENVTNMSEIMLECDIAVSAGGSTTYELCACGLPMILFSFADNQLEIVRTHDEQGTGIYCGDYRDEKERTIMRIVDKVCELTKDADMRRHLFQDSIELVDAKGASRIVEKLIEYYL